MPNPTASDVHVNMPLTNISIAFIQQTNMYIAERVFPRVPVLKQSDRFFKYDKGDFYRIEAQERAPGTESAGAGFRIDNTPTYFAPVFAVHKDIDDQIRANADRPINMDRDATLYVTQQLLMKRDRQFVDDYMTTGVWDTDLTGVAAAPGANQFLHWDNDLSDPVRDITEQVIEITSTTGFRPNVLAIGPHVFRALKNHPDVIDRIKYTQRGVVTAEILAALFDIERVEVAWSVENTGTENAVDNVNYIAGKNALLVYANPSPSILQPSAGYIFTWTGLLGAGAFGNRIKRFRIEQLSADRVEGEMAFDTNVVSSDLGVFFASAVS